jgi:peptidoglycan/LPS O-acetylase OafA/YrhL
LSALGLTFVVIILCAAGPYRGILLGGAHPGPLFVFSGAANIALALIIIVWAIFTTGQKGGRFDGVLGDLSYIFYLLHWPILEIINTGEGSSLRRGALIGAAFVVALIGSVLILIIFDHPINRLRSKWVAKRVISKSSI